MADNESGLLERVEQLERRVATLEKAVEDKSIAQAVSRVLKAEMEAEKASGYDYY